MGTVYNIKIISKPLKSYLHSEIQTSIDSSLKQVNQKMSTYIEDSEISRFNNHQSTKGFKVSTEFVKVLNEALNIYQLSNGAFDITVNPLVNLWGFGSGKKVTTIPSEKKIQEILKKIGSDQINIVDENTIKKNIPELEIDLGAIAKGYGVDVVAQVISNYNFDDFMVEIGGEVFVKGRNHRNENWRIGIDKPKYLALPGEDLQNILSISNVGMATSGDYRNFIEYEGKIYSHTINPRTGKPVDHNLASVTIIAPTCIKADALATAVLVMGSEKGLQLIESLENIEGYLINRLDADKFEAVSSSGFKKYLN